MTKEELYEALADLDEAEVAAAQKPFQKRAWAKWTALAASLFLLVGIGTFAWTRWQNQETAITSEEVAVGFELNNAMYFPISYDERGRFGLLSEGPEGAGAVFIQPTREDLGALMGAVELPTNDGTTMVNVYHYNAYPDYDAICIVEFSDGLYFYVASGYTLEDDVGIASDLFLETYGMPGSVTKLTVQTGDWETVLTITDRETIEALCALLGGKENIGMEEHNRLFALLWQEVYGNDDVYYDESDGTVHYRSGLTGEPQTHTYTDAEGNEITEVEPDTVFEEIYETAHALWSQGERVVWFTTDKGFEFYLIFNPAIGTFSTHNGYYCMTSAEVAQMKALLEIP